MYAESSARSPLGTSRHPSPALYAQDHNTTIEVMEFLEFLQLDRSPFALKAFGVMDMDGRSVRNTVVDARPPPLPNPSLTLPRTSPSWCTPSGNINFFEFAVSTWNYCTLNKTTLVSFRKVVSQRWR